MHVFLATELVQSMEAFDAHVTDPSLFLEGLLVHASRFGRLTLELRAT